MSILAFLAIIAACVTPIVITYILVRGLTRSSREEMMREKVNQWGEDVKTRVADVEASLARFAREWREWKEGQ